MNLGRRAFGHLVAAGIRMLEKRGAGGASLQRAPSRETTPDLDRTGLLVNTADKLPIAWRDAEVIYPKYENSLAHSFWRAQEFSLLMQHQAMLKRPILDLGCGDGSFSAVLFERIDYGVDIDPNALEIALKFGIYDQLLQSGTAHIPLPDASVASVFSNSVLEHVNGLEPVILEVSRILKPGGVFVFSVPVQQFARDLTYWFGQAESRSVNEAYYHRNLMEEADWASLLARCGFELKSSRTYQPASFTYSYWMYRLCGDRALGRFFPRIREWIWSRKGRELVEEVRSSIRHGAASGANCFFVAVRRSERP